MALTILKGKFIYLIVGGFILATIVGTISHEYGHIAVAKYLGYNTSLHFSSMGYSKDPSHISQKVKDSLSTREFEALTRLRKSESHCITLGGPIQTGIVGLFGFGVLWIRRNKRLSFSLKDWFCVILTFFLARQILNFGVQIVRYFITGEHKNTGDEIKLALYLDWPIYSIAFSTCLFSILICCITVFKFIPQEYRIRFIWSGRIGCGIGYFVWMVWLGPILLP